LLPNRPFQAKVASSIITAPLSEKPAADAPGFDWQGVIP
jgi:hypothetical protein